MREKTLRTMQIQGSWEEKMSKSQKWRMEALALSDEELDDELLRPSDDWNTDVLRETLRRILKRTSQTVDSGNLGGKDGIN